MLRTDAITTAKELRQAYIDYFQHQGHAEINSAPLIPENDPTVLFTTAGMHPLVPFLLGEKHPAGNRLVNCQKCLRTDDIEEVGDTTHLTFFEMLGNWSLGDYFKEEAIRMSYEFLTEVLGLPAERLWISCFAGDADAPQDEEAASIWRRMGIPESRIVFLDKSYNWWGPAGETGPCVPDTEMFIELPGEACSSQCGVTCECGKFVEIWNDVFMQYNKTAEGRYEPLEQKNVDTGMGLERVTALLQGKKSCYETELFSGILADLAERISEPAPAESRSCRLIAEHVRAAAFLMADGVRPGNVDQGYVLRRLIRRSLQEMRNLGIREPIFATLTERVVRDYGETYPELAASRGEISTEAKNEEEQFITTLEKGSREFEKLMAKMPSDLEHKRISGRKAFHLYETYGLPLEVIREMAGEHGASVDEEGFREAYRKHQEKSRAGAEQKFKGGLVDQSERTTALHTATHLLHQALREILGDHVTQAGSNINAERLRFDFTHEEKLSSEELNKVESRVNDIIRRDLPVECKEMTLEEAKEAGAVATFADRYGDKVKVYRIGDFSLEICGGPHVGRTGELGGFKIKKEESSSRGVRRIKAVLTEQDQ